MNRLVKAALLAGAAFGVMASAAQAQQTPNVEAQVSSVDDIIVSARRRDEALKDVPVAVSAFSAEQLGTEGLGRHH